MLLARLNSGYLEPYRLRTQAPVKDSPEVTSAYDNYDAQFVSRFPESKRAKALGILRQTRELSLLGDEVKAQVTADVFELNAMLG